MNSNCFRNIALVIVSALALGACAGGNVKPAPIANNAPEWVNKGSGAMKDQANVCVVVPYETTPHVEGFHVVLHHLVAFCLAEKIAAS